MNYTKNHLGAGKSVCPFANRAEKKGKIVYHEINTNESDSEILENLTAKNIISQLQANDAIVFRLTATSQNHNQAKDTAYRIEKIIFSLLSRLAQELFMFAQNPLYPLNHPRYSPEEVFIITKKEDFSNVTDDAAIKIRCLALMAVAEIHCDSDLVDRIKADNSRYPTEIANDLNYSGTRLYEPPPKIQ